MTSMAQRENIPPLLKTTWGQGMPYNCMLPLLGNGAAPQTGCNATATAQVIRYHEHAKGCSYNFSLMPNSLKDFEGTSSQAQTIGLLMKDLGKAMNMQYGQYDSTSGITTPGQALVNTFGYDASLKILRREYFTDAAWEEMIYNELKEGRPVIYSGQRNNGTHCFVIHGYDAEKNLFAINWGWEGYCDGYSPLTGSEALVSGAYGSEGYTTDQIAIFGVCPDKGGKESLVVGTRGNYLFNSLGNNSHYDNRDVDLSKTKKTFYLVLSYYNTSISDLTDMQCGVMFREKSTGKTYYTQKLKAVTLESGKYQTSNVMLEFNTSLLTYNGVYEIFPVARPKNSYSSTPWTPVMIPASQTPSTITCYNGKDDPTSGISTAEDKSLGCDDVEYIVTPDGKKHATIQKGMNIIKLKNGSVRKLFLLNK